MRSRSAVIADARATRVTRLSLTHHARAAHYITDMLRELALNARAETLVAPAARRSREIEMVGVLLDPTGLSARNLVQPSPTLGQIAVIHFVHLGSTGASASTSDVCPYVPGFG